MPLYTLATIDRHGRGQPVFQSVLRREDQVHIAIFLAAVRKVVGDQVDLSSTVFVIDKDAAEIGALNTVFPGQTFLLCRFHVIRAMTDEIKKMPVTLEDKETLVSVRFTQT